MKRRHFLTGAGAGAAAGVLAAPARARSQLQVRWRMASSFAKSLDMLFGSAEHISSRVSRLTDGRFEIRVFAAGEIVPPSRFSMPCKTGPSNAARLRAATRQHRHPDGRMVPQGGEDGGRSQGPQDARGGSRGPDPRAPRRGATADRRGGHLSGARERHRRCRRVGRTLR